MSQNSQLDSNANTESQNVRGWKGPLWVIYTEIPTNSDLLNSLKAPGKSHGNKEPTDLLRTSHRELFSFPWQRS